MRINWKLRFKNKTVFTTLVITTMAFIYQILGILGITPAITEDNATQIIALLINVLAGLGILVDPTTKGASDSKTALNSDDLR